MILIHGLIHCSDELAVDFVDLSLSTLFVYLNVKAFLRNVDFEVHFNRGQVDKNISIKFS